MKEFPGQGFRRVVPSPRPLAIQELPQIKCLFDAGELIVAAGGGGIPVVRGRDGSFQGIEAVIDKDLSAALLAVGLDADTLAIVTSVDRVCLNFGRPDETPLRRLTLVQAREHLADGQFPPGSMGPKIEAAINFLQASTHPDPSVIIASIDGLGRALAGQTGTLVMRN